MSGADIGRSATAILLIGVSLSSFILCLASIDAGHDWGDDFALYISQARSIVEGSTEELLEQNTVTSLRSSDVLGPALYPVGFPLLLAPMYSVFGVDLVAFKRAILWAC